MELLLKEYGFCFEYKRCKTVAEIDLSFGSDALDCWCYILVGYYTNCNRMLSACTTSGEFVSCGYERIPLDRFIEKLKRGEL